MRYYPFKIAGVAFPFLYTPTVFSYWFTTFGRNDLLSSPPAAIAFGCGLFSLNSCYSFMAISCCCFSLLKPTKLSRSLVRLLLITKSSLVSADRLGDKFTSRSHGLNLLSTSMSKPSNSKQLEFFCFTPAF
jgi:hypothetical protein